MRYHFLFLIFAPAALLLAGTLYAEHQVQHSPPKRVALREWYAVGSDDSGRRLRFAGDAFSISKGRLLFRTQNLRAGVKELEIQLDADIQKKIIEEIEAGIGEIEANEPVLEKFENERERVLDQFREKYADRSDLRFIFLCGLNDNKNDKLVEEVRIERFVGDDNAPIGFFGLPQPWTLLRTEVVEDPGLSLQELNQRDEFMRNEWDPKVNELKHDVLKRLLKHDQYEMFVQMYAGSLGVNILACEEFREVLRLTAKQRTKIDKIYQSAAKMVDQKLKQWQALTDGGAPIDLLRDFQQHMTQQQFEYEDQLDAVLTKRQLETVKSWRDRCWQADLLKDHEVIPIPYAYDITGKMSRQEYEAWKKALVGSDKKRSSKSANGQHEASNSAEKESEK